MPRLDAYRPEERCVGFPMALRSRDCSRSTESFGNLQLHDEGGMRIGEVAMRYRGTILSGSAALLLMGVTGCFSQQHNGSQSSGTGSGGAHVTNASWTP